MVYLLTAIGLTPGGSRYNTRLQTNTLNNTMKQNTQNRTHITIRINKITVRINNLQNHTKHATIYTMKQNRTERI